MEAVRAENQLLQLGNSSVDVETLNQELAFVRSQLATEGASREPIETELAKLAADREELAQLKKWAKEAADELRREERSMELEKVRTVPTV